MSPVRAVKDPEPSPKPIRARGKSGVRYPYYDLADAVTVATKIHREAGGSCSRSQLAAILGHKGINSGAFLTRVSAAKMFGLIEATTDGKVKVTQRGTTIVAPVSDDAAARAKLEAFFAVDLFKMVFKEYDGTTLPAEVGLKNLFETTYGVVNDRITPTVRIMMDSAEYAGLFPNGNKSRMVMPLNLPVGAAADPQKQTAKENEGTATSGGGGGGSGGSGGDGGGGTDVDGLDAALVGFLRLLPEANSRLSAKRRQTIKTAFGGLLDVLYPEDEE